VITTADSLRLTPNIDRRFVATLVDRLHTSGDGGSTPVVSPFDESEFTVVPVASDADVLAAVDRARRAQLEWARRSRADRKRVLSTFHDLLIDNADLAMDLVQLESGKARIPAFEEIYDTIATTHYYLKVGPGLLRTRRRAVSLPGFTTAYELRHPVGVVGCITPWNFPFTLSISDMIPALLAGNGVVIKPDEKTPLSALYGARLLEDAGVPPDLVQIVTGPGDVIGPTLIGAVDFIMFTGSTEVGRLVAEQAGRRLVGSSMELGGKNSAVVLADADLDKTVPGIARAVFANGGQLCTAMERIHVDESIRAEFTERFVEHTRGLAMTPGFDFSSALSSMITREHLENVDAHVQDAVANGATLLTGGKARPDIGPLFYEPTVLTDVDDSMEICRNETFGPVVTIYGFESVEDAVREANASDFGLNFSVWTEDTRRGFEVASRLQAGTVGVNDGYAAAWSSYDAPMGGMKASGQGRRHGSEGLLKFTEAQTIAVQKVGPAFAPIAGLGYETYHLLLGKALKLLKWIPFYK
jgi:succinate-semialdehyde dehydrogenase / glutarate-semialdehyde dehydrogenase